MAGVTREDAAKLLGTMRDAAMEEAGRDLRSIRTVVRGTPPNLSIVSMENAVGVFVDELPTGRWDCEVLFEKGKVEQRVSVEATFATADEAMGVARFILREAARNAIRNDPANALPFAFDDMVVTVPKSLVEDVAATFPERDVAQPVGPALDGLLKEFRRLRVAGAIQGSTARKGSLEGEAVLEAIQTSAVIALSQGIARWPATPLN